MNRSMLVMLVATVSLGLGAWVVYGNRRGSSGNADGSRFDPAMSGVCQFSCAVQEPYDEAQVAAQPDVADGRLTRCPVSGVVFAVADDRPRVALDRGAYRLCCETCAEKFRKDPGRFIDL